jgi:FAD dependent monooxygenase
MYWFYFEKLDKKYYAPNIPRFTDEDAVKTCEKQLDAIVAEGVTFKTLWTHRKSAIKVPIEEGLLSRWHYSHFAVLGDAVHKVIVRRAQSDEIVLQ